jgi:membrane associated rhomboid family serine protease
MEMETEQCEVREGDWLALIPEMVAGQSAAHPSGRRVRLWALVLDARSVPCHIEASDRGWQLLVPADRLAEAYNELCLFEEENRLWPPLPPQERPLVENTLATVSVLILLASFHNLTQIKAPLFGHVVPDWLDLGRAQAAQILDGQWWRLITALTLHSDWVHLLSNLAIGGVFVVLLCRELGSGLAWTLLLAAGMFGNLLNAEVQLPSHSAIGSSTAVFGTVGILAALSLVRYRNHLRRRWPMPVASAMALLALLGTEGERTDLGAHLFGFVCGILIGLVTEYLIEKYGQPGRRLSGLLAVFSAVLVVASWWAAVLFAG